MPTKLYHGSVGHKGSTTMKEEKIQNQISLTFIVNGKEANVEKVNLHQPLKVSVEKALEETGNTGRELSDWQVKWNDIELDITKKVEELNIPSSAKLFISLRAGQGGEK
jgi:hypothetical protein